MNHFVGTATNDNGFSMTKENGPSVLDVLTDLTREIVTFHIASVTVAITNKPIEKEDVIRSRSSRNQITIHINLDLSTHD